MPFQPPALPPQIAADDADRARWTGLLLSHAAKSGLPSIRVQRRSDGAKSAGAGPWFYVHVPTSATYHLRCIQPSQSVFDIGDDEVTATSRKPTPWTQTAEWSDAIMEAMTRLGIPFQAGPSGGKGFHIEWWLEPRSPSRIDLKGACANCGHSREWHVDGYSQNWCRVGKGFAEAIVRNRLSAGDDPLRYLGHLAGIGGNGGLSWGDCLCHKFENPPAADAIDRRWHVANSIIAEAHRIILSRRKAGSPSTVGGAQGRGGDDSEDEPPRIRFDHRLIAPNVDSQECREWGERKVAGEPKRRLLLHDGPGPAAPLPREQAECYRIAEARAKECGLRPRGIPVSGADRLDTQWVADLFGKPCPQGPQCSDTGGWPTCHGCPAMGDA